MKHSLVNKKKLIIFCCSFFLFFNSRPSSSVGQSSLDLGEHLSVPRNLEGEEEVAVGDLIDISSEPGTTDMHTHMHTHMHICYCVCV